MRLLIPVLLFALICGPALAAAQDRPFLLDTEPLLPGSVEDGEGWKEGTSGLPPWPKDEDLVEFDVDDPGSRLRYYIDGKNLAVGNDEVVRYTLVVESPSGVRNLSFEGMRCTPAGAFRVYAYGNNGRFDKIDDDWNRVRGRHDDQVHRDLHQRFLCLPQGFEPRARKDMIHAMKSRAPDTTSFGFLSN